MEYSKLREALKKYYTDISLQNSKELFEKCNDEANASYHEGMSVFDMKVLQYRTITKNFDPIIFHDLPFYFETGVIPGLSDGARDFHGLKHAGGWTYFKNEHRFVEQDESLWDLTCKQRREKFYLVCGYYNDSSQHFQFNMRPIFEHGLHGVYDRAKSLIESAVTDKEKAFLSAVCEGLLCVKHASEKFAQKAKVLLNLYPENENFKLIAESAERCPWEKPKNFYEALNSYAFMRKIIGSLEGIGPNSFGRIDMDLYPFYESDISRHTLTEEKALDYISKFLIMFDCHYDHDQKMVGYADHELENTYVLGGCDENGEPIYNDLTKLFLRATREQKIIFPKIICRFSDKSPKEYLDEVDEAVINGTTTILYQNDNSTINALCANGIPIKEARDYLITGCWSVALAYSTSANDGNYLNILKPFEYEIHNLTEKMREVGMIFTTIDKAKNFEEVYKITCENIYLLMKEKARILKKGGQIWDRVDVLPILSSTYADCLKNKRDYTSGGARYKFDACTIIGFPDVIDSLLAIKELCFDTKKYSLEELLKAVRNNWAGYDEIRSDAIRCHGYGDNSKESCELAKRLNFDLYKMLGTLSAPFGGKIFLGHLAYTEIRFWGEQTHATPNGRFNGDYISQGLTPSRLKKIPGVTALINSLAELKSEELPGNSVVNIMLSGKISLDNCAALLRVASHTAMQSLQLNCVSRETLLDAQKHPEKYPDLIVRVCGFSAKFTSLSPEWQEEVISRNFYN